MGGACPHKTARNCRRSNSR
ncbi:MAG: hypothetical protein DME24_02400 [Verrucomicrobia bacterium]|nr:MAG: hypothetical protein DME24_02400 [Verrucomicrobiota bacterium]